MPNNADWDFDEWHREPDLDRLEAEARRTWVCPWCGFRNTRADCVYVCQQCETFR